VVLEQAILEEELGAATPELAGFLAKNMTVEHAAYWNPTATPVN
jgi:hypothetical protein